MLGSNTFEMKATNFHGIELSSHVELIRFSLHFPEGGLHRESYFFAFFGISFPFIPILVLLTDGTMLRFCSRCGEYKFCENFTF